MTSHTQDILLNLQMQGTATNQNDFLSCTINKSFWFTLLNISKVSKFKGVYILEN